MIDERDELQFRPKRCGQSFGPAHCVGYLNFFSGDDYDHNIRLQYLLISQISIYLIEKRGILQCFIYVTEKKKFTKF